MENLIFTSVWCFQVVEAVLSKESLSTDAEKKVSIEIYLYF